MTWGDWLALWVSAGLVLIFVAGAVFVGRIEKRRGSDGPPLFSKVERVTWPVAVGAALVGVGTFTADAQDLRSFLVSLGASILGAGGVAATSM